MTRLNRSSLTVPFLAVLALGGLAAVRYQRWVNDCGRRLADGSTVVKTPKGPVEYASSGTAGPTILFVHGQPGGYDQGLFLGKEAVRHDFRLLTISRPGYLRTPLNVGRTPAEQADAFAALLDTLGISQVAVVSLSGGGPAAIEFALRHPTRCVALVAIAAVSHSKDPPANVASWLLANRFFTSNLAGWLIGAVVKHWPALLAQALVPSAEARAEVLSDPQKLSVLVGIAQAGIQLPAQRRAGSRNDVEQFATLRLFPVHTIRVPTLVIHGTADKLVPYSHALFVAEEVPGAELYPIEGGTHAIIATQVDQVLTRLFAFLSAHSKDMARQ